MNNRLTRSARRALLPALAVAALFAALPAQADQQITNAQMDNALNWGAGSGTRDSGAYAQAVRPYRGHVRHDR